MSGGDGDRQESWIPYAPDAADDVTAAARALLGARLTKGTCRAKTGIVITEVEAYGGADDPASHAFRGKTGRNASMFGPPGTLYVYRIYGMHWCANIVVGPPGSPGAVLIRGGEPVIGRETMAARRGREDHLTDGPGKVCSALGITGEDDGSSVTDGPVRVMMPEDPPELQIEATPRIGIRVGTDRKWRYIAHPTGGSSLAVT